MKSSVSDSIVSHLDNLRLIQNKINLAIQVQREQMALLEIVGSSDISMAYATLARLEILGARDIRALDLKQYSKSTMDPSKESRQEHPFIQLTKDRPMTPLGQQLLKKISQKELTSAADVLSFLMHVKLNRAEGDSTINISDLKAITEAFGFNSEGSNLILNANFFKIPKDPIHFWEAVKPFGGLRAPHLFEYKIKSGSGGFYCYKYAPVVTVPWLFFFLKELSLSEARDYLNWLEAHYSETRNIEVAKITAPSEELLKLKGELKSVGFFSIKKRIALDYNIRRLKGEVVSTGVSDNKNKVDTIYGYKLEEVAKFKDALNMLEPMLGEDFMVNMLFENSKFGDFIDFKMTISVKE